MNFDQIGEQRVSRRRKPSPLNNSGYIPASFDAVFPQKVWPRPGPAGNKINAVKEEAHRQQPEKRKRAKGSAGFSVSSSALKKIAVMGGVLVIALIGPNWDSISEWFRNYEVSPESLRDNGAYWEARWEPFSFGEKTAQPAADNDLDQLINDIPLNLTDTFSWTEYRVREGETISGIAARHRVTIGSIIAFNGIKEAWNLRAGRMLKIPNMDGIPYTVQKNDSLSKIAEKTKVPLNAILDANDIRNNNIQPGNVLFLPGAKMDVAELTRAVKRDTAKRNAPRPENRPMIKPIPGHITSGYGWRLDPVNPKPGVQLLHRAIDFFGNTGDPVKAAMKGRVLYIDNNPTLGNFIILKHGELQSLYAHLSAFSVEVGDEVNQGQEIGKVGETGYTTGPHLHFAVFRNGNAVNPLDLLK